MQQLKSYYTTPQPNESILLFQGPLIVIHEINGHNVPIMSGQGSLRLEWLREPHLEVKLSYTSTAPVTQGLPVQIQLYRATTTETTTGEPVVYTGEIQGSVVKDIEWSWTEEPTQNLFSVIFHLPNYLAYNGTQIQSEDTDCQNDSKSWAGRLIMEAADWHITLDTVAKYEDLKEYLQDRGGYALTHTGRIQRSDGQPFKHPNNIRLHHSFVGTGFCIPFQC